MSVLSCRPDQQASLSRCKQNDRLTRQLVAGILRFGWHRLGVGGSWVIGILRRRGFSESYSGFFKMDLYSGFSESSDVVGGSWVAETGTTCRHLWVAP